MIKRICILLIVFYQKVISPIKGPSCRFYPSCSTYTIQAIEKYGVVSGILKGIVRVCCCHPWHPGGYDPLS